ncbi:hypothetical protein RJ641_003914 [Dillenia turbinata]|uniref:C2H2-type domain-containing protein n=1 Tax=Dillenia turbinata TaxID=194707 RepID=A0AAN8ZCE9_9MAGN
MERSDHNKGTLAESKSTSSNILQVSKCETPTQRKYMERHIVDTHFKGKSMIRDLNNNNNINKVKDLFECTSGSLRDDYLSGFSWPPRSYTCSFCKREFRSAQALGGHMNVHRRDRARLRQSPPRDGQYPLLNLNLNASPNPNPNPNPNTTFSSPSSSSTRLPPFAYALPTLVSPSELKKRATEGNHVEPSRGRNHDESMEPKYAKSFFEVKDFTHGDKCKVLEKSEVVKLDLEIGLFNNAKEDLDLELRLGI